MPNLGRTAKEVFDDWALDYHAPGMEDGHWPAVREAFELIQPSSGNYLEVGVGNGYGIRHMATTKFKSGKCHGIDISENMIALARSRTQDLSNVTLEVADFPTWQPETRFDLIFSMEVFYYFPDMDEAIAHARELLRPGGTCMVLVNHYREHQESHAWPGQLDTPMHLWSADEYREALERAGFSDVRQHFFHAPDDTNERAKNPGTLGTWGVKE